MITRFIYFVYPKNIIKLRNLRESLSQEILYFVNLHIKEADPKYESERILYKTESENGDSEEIIMKRRNSNRKPKRILQELSSILGS
jgi:hypothetical protein